MLIFLTTFDDLSSFVRLANYTQSSLSLTTNEKDLIYANCLNKSSSLSEILFKIEAPILTLSRFREFSIFSKVIPFTYSRATNSTVLYREFFIS